MVQYMLNILMAIVMNFEGLPTLNRIFCGLTEGHKIVYSLMFNVFIWNILALDIQAI